MKKNLEDNLFNIRNLEFANKFKKNNFNLNVFFANYLPQTDNMYNKDDK